MYYFMLMFWSAVAFLLTMILIRLTYRRAAAVRDKYLMFRESDTITKFVVSLIEADHELPIFRGKTMFSPVELVYFPELDFILNGGGVEVNLRKNKVSSFSMPHLLWTLLLAALLTCAFLLHMYTIVLAVSYMNLHWFIEVFLLLLVCYVAVLMLLTYDKLRIAHDYTHAVTLGVAENIMRQIHANGLYKLPTDTVNSFAKSNKTFTGILHHTFVAVDYMKITKLETEIPEGIKVKFKEYVPDSV